MRDMSRLPPGLFSISPMPITCRLTGLTFSMRNGVALTVTPASTDASSSISTTTGGSVADTTYSSDTASL